MGNNCSVCKGSEQEDELTYSMEENMPAQRNQKKQYNVGRSGYSSNQQDNPELNNAATKIQSRWKGNKARKNYREK